MGCKQKRLAREDIYAPGKECGGKGLPERFKKSGPTEKCCPFEEIKTRSTP
jgi:hypothetical protein